MNLSNTFFKTNRFYFILFFILLVFLSVAMIVSYGPLCPGQDFHFHFMRFTALMDALRDGRFPFYIDYKAIDGYGYFTKAFYCDFVLIPFALLGNMTNAEFAYKAMLFVMTLLCGLFTYIAVNKVYKNNIAAYISAILYTFCSYRLLDLYHRAALGEAFSFTFLPLVFLGLYYIIRGDYKKWYVFTIGYSLILFTHVISSVLTAITILIFLIIYNRSLRNDVKRIKYLVISALATLAIVSYYLFPMIEQMLSDTFYYQTRQLMAQAQDSKMALNWIFWGLFSGGVQPRQIFIPGIGLLLTVAVCLRLFVFQKTKELKSVDILVIVGLCYIVAVSSLFPWHIFPFSTLNFIQLPWRLFEFVSFFFAVAGGYYFSKALVTKKRIIAASFLLLVATLFMMVSDGDLYKSTRCLGDINEKPTVANSYLLGGLEYIPSSVPSIEYLADRGDSVSVSNASSIDNLTKVAGVLNLNVVTDKSTDIELPLIYYKGYSAIQSETELTVSCSPKGLASIQTNNSGKITVYYKGTVLQHISFYISIVSVLLLCVYIFREERRSKKKII